MLIIFLSGMNYHYLYILWHCLIRIIIMLFGLLDFLFFLLHTIVQEYIVIRKSSHWRRCCMHSNRVEEDFRLGTLLPPCFFFLLDWSRTFSLTMYYRLVAVDVLETHGFRRKTFYISSKWRRTKIYFTFFDKVKIARRWMWKRSSHKIFFL